MSRSNKKRAAPTEEKAREAFHLGDAEGEYGVKGAKFRHPRFRKFKEETAETKSIGACQYEQILEKTSTSPGGYLTMVFPYFAAKKLPGPRAEKVSYRTKKGIEEDERIAALKARDRASMPPPSAPAPRKKFTPQELRQVDLGSVMEDLRESELASLPNGVTSTVVTTNSTTVTTDEQGTTVTHEHLVSTSISQPHPDEASESAVDASQPPSAPPTPLRMGFDGSVLPHLFDPSASPCNIQYSPYRPAAAGTGPSSSSMPLPSPVYPYFPSPSRSPRPSSAYNNDSSQSFEARNLLLASPGSFVHLLSTPSASPLPSPSDFPSPLVGMSPSVWTTTPQRLTPSSFGIGAGAPSARQDVDSVTADLLCVHAASRSLPKVNQQK